MTVYRLAANLIYYHMQVIAENTLSGCHESVRTAARLLVYPIDIAGVSAIGIKIICHKNPPPDPYVLSFLQSR